MNEKKNSSPEVSVVIPCLNEAKGLRALLPKLPGVADEVVVVDNGSTDDTAEVARSLAARVIYEGKRGYGQAYRRGLAAARGNIIVTMDGDDTYPSAVVPEVIKYLRKNRLDFINCARFPLVNPKSMPAKNYWANRFTTLMTNWLFGCKLMDSQSGMWVFRRQVVEKIMPRGKGMDFSLEIKLNAIADQGVRFGEYHINYGERVGGVSKYQPLKDSIGILSTFFRLWRRKLRQRRDKR